MSAPVLTARETRLIQPEAAPAIKRSFRTINTSIRIHCGCGFRANNLHDAEQHAFGHGHVLHITGSITGSF